MIVINHFIIFFQRLSALNLCFFQKSGLIYACLKPIVTQLTNAAQSLRARPLSGFTRLMDYDAWAHGRGWTVIH